MDPIIINPARSILGARTNSNTVLRTAREIERMYSVPRVVSALAFDEGSGSPDPTPDIFDERPSDMDSIKKEMKQRHLTRSERDAFHNPETDWVQTPRGEVCKNACSLEVEDIITKYKD